MLDRQIAWVGCLAARCDRVQVGCVRRVGHRRALAPGVVEHLREDELSPVGAFELEQAVDGITPLLRLEGIRIGSRRHTVDPKLPGNRARHNFSH